MLSLVNPLFKILFSQVGGTVILFRREEYAARVVSVVLLELEVAAESVLQLTDVLFSFFHFALMALIKP
ncbi:hypothetical protein [Candidatus Albibeggiatoa sp. nov. NOAA]|uniref:hypothetical protein n=1 Tax=Candidatus Albibeggiatoa sp. nov. NOAA TaxID=3162724 RepID=UPI0032F39A7F|nr:hypothetical protein [Thiotrichaceae bacterium]